MINPHELKVKLDEKLYVACMNFMEVSSLTKTELMRFSLYSFLRKEGFLNG